MSEETDSANEVARLKGLMLKKIFYIMRRKIIDPQKLPSVMLDHYQWIIGLEKQGVIFASGPVTERDGRPGVGMTVFKVGSFEEAERLAATDPFCLSGAAEFDIACWQVNEGRMSVTVDFSDQTFTID